MASYKENNWRGESLFQDSRQEGETVIITGNRKVLDLSWAPQQEKKKGKWIGVPPLLAYNRRCKSRQKNVFSFSLK